MDYPEVQIIPLINLVHDGSNPRSHDERNLGAIISSLEEHGQVEPLVVQSKTMMVIGGNGRLEAMRTMGWMEAHCAMLDVTDIQARRLSISLNRTSDLAGWDLSTLSGHLDELSVEDDSFDPSDLGFSDEEFMELIASIDSGFDELEHDAPSDDGDVAGKAKPAEDGADEDQIRSHVRMIQLFFNEKTEPQLRTWCKKLAEEFDTDNLTDTIFELVSQAAVARGWGEE